VLAWFRCRVICSLVGRKAPRLVGYRAQAASGLNQFYPRSGEGTMAKAKRSRSRKPKSKPDLLQVPKLDSLKQINLNAAGLDIGDDEIYVAVPEDRDAVSVKVFPTFTADLYRLADWLAACGVTTVAMESTGVYWIPIYEVLEERGFKVYLVNARHLKNVTGKKTDILDCQWIQQLHTYGLLRASFRPPEEICAVRALVRHRHSMIESSSREIQHMQKALQQMNIKLTNVISDLTGDTGMKIIRDIVAGERNPHQLAHHRNNHCAKSEDEIAEALRGHYKPWKRTTFFGSKSGRAMSNWRSDMPPSRPKWT
jgi:transposase